MAKAYELVGITQDIAYTENRDRQAPSGEDEFARLPTRY